MRMILRAVGLAATLALVLPLVSAQYQSKTVPDKQDKVTSLPKVQGLLENPGSDKGNLVVNVPYLERQAKGRPTVKHKPVDLSPADDMQVRTAAPPPQFDEKGNRRKPTPKELKELKGEGNLPGYKSDLSSLKKGQEVVCYVLMPKKKKKDDLDKDSVGDKPRIKLILIVKEPTG